MSIYDPTRLTAADIEALKNARREAGDMGIPDDVGEADPSWWHLDKAVRVLIDKTIVTADAQSQLSNYDRTIWHLAMAKDSHTVAGAHMHAACATAHAALAQIDAQATTPPSPAPDSPSASGTPAEVDGQSSGPQSARADSAGGAS